MLTGVQAQSLIDNARVNGSFQVDAQFYRPDKAIGISDSTIDGRKVGINGYGNINYTLGDFSAGMRYEPSWALLPVTIRATKAMGFLISGLPIKPK